MASLNEVLERNVSSSEAGRTNSRTLTAGWKGAKSNFRILYRPTPLDNMKNYQILVKVLERGTCETEGSLKV